MIQYLLSPQLLRSRGWRGFRVPSFLGGWQLSVAGGWRLGETALGGVLFVTCYLWSSERRQ